MTNDQENILDIGGANTAYHNQIDAAIRARDYMVTLQLSVGGHMPNQNLINQLTETKICYKLGQPKL